MTSNISSLSKGLIAHYPLNGESDRSILSSTDILAGLNFASGWDTTGITVNSATSWTAVTGGGPFNASKVEVGKKYRLHLKGTTTASSFRLTNSSNSQNISGDLTGSFDVTIDFIPILTSLYFRNANVGGTTTTLTEFSIREITSDLTGDITPNANHGTNNGATLSTGRKGEANGSYSFDGVNDYIDCNNAIIQETGEFTVSGWIYPTQQKYNVLVSQHLGASDNRLFLSTTDQNLVRFQIGSASDTISYISLNQWNHLVFIRDSSNVTKVYINSVFAPLAGSATNPSPIYQGNTKIGGTEISTHYAKGSISDVRIYNRALEEDEIKLLYDSFKPEIATSDLNKGLVGHWMLDSENGVKDLTPNGNHGTNNGATLSTGRKGESNGSYVFDGTDDYILVNKLNVIKSYSLWVNTNSVSNGVIFTNYQTGSGLGFYNGNGLILKSGTSGSIKRIALLPAGFSVGNWYHIAVNYAEDGIPSCYINGVETKYGGDNFWIESANSYIQIGRRISGTYWNGKLSDFRIYDRALSVDEIKLLYDQYKPKEASVCSLNKGLVLDMPLTTKHMKSSTVVSDLTPNGNDGTVVGATVGSQYTSFDGSGDYVDCGSSGELDNPYPITISFYINNKDTTQSYKRIITSPVEFTNSFHAVTITGGIIQFGYDNNVLVNTRQTSFSNQQNTWQHVVLVIESDTSNNKCYLDGVAGTVGSGGGTVLASGNVRIASSPNNTGYFNGDISQVKIYNRALSAAEVKLLYESTPKPAITEETINEGLVLDMPLKTPYVSGTTVIDKTGTNNGTNSGATISADSASFDGTDDKITLTSVPSNNTTGAISIWFKAISVPGTLAMIVDSYNKTVPGYGFTAFLSPSTGKMSIRYGVNNEYNAIKDGYDFRDNAWHNLIMTSDATANTFKTYIDNILIESSIAPASFNIGSYFTIGSREDTYFFNGLISNAKVWNRALTPEEVAVIYAKGRV